MEGVSHGTRLHQVQWFNTCCTVGLVSLNPRIYLLAFGTFTVGTEGYVVAGVLPDVAHDLHTSVAAVGQLVTVFALAYAIAGPPVVGMLHQARPRHLMLAAAIVFAAANLLAALSPSMAVLIVARVVAAIGAALFMAPAATTAAALAPPQQLARAIAIPATGNAIALTIGAPLGTVAASIWGWRAAFILVTILAGATAVLVLIAVPDVDPAPPTGIKRTDLIRRAGIRWAFATTFLIFLAAYTAYTYLSPIVKTATGHGASTVAVLMVIFGAGGLTGGRLIGKILATRTLGKTQPTLLAVMAIALAVITGITGTSWAGPTTRVIALAITMFILGIAWWSSGISQQTRFALLAPEHRSTALSLHFSAQFLGVAGAGALGGLVITTAGTVGVPLTATLVALLALTTLHELPAPAQPSKDTGSRTSLGGHVPRTGGPR